jgi:fibronectin type 3 domain-containing protein
VIFATSKAVLIAWDMGRGPTYKSDSPERAHALYRVYRNGVAIGDTTAEAFDDILVHPGAVYTYRVCAVDEEGTETAVGPSFEVHVPRRPPKDLIPPTAPADLTATVNGDVVEWEWTPGSEEDPTRLLAYLVYDSAQEQPAAVVWAHDADGEPVTSWSEPWS